MIPAGGTQSLLPGFILIEGAGSYGAKSSSFLVVNLMLLKENRLYRLEEVNYTV